MPQPTTYPVAVRATAFIRPSKWRHRTRRLVRYDAYWADGHVDFGVDLSTMMYRGHPADFATVDERVHAHCPEIGTGQWVDEAGRVVEGPELTDPDPQANRTGTPRKYRAPGYEPNIKARRAWRLGGGAAGLTLGVLLLTGSAGEGFAGFAGMLCPLFGLSSLAGLIPGKRRPR